MPTTTDDGPLRFERFELHPAQRVLRVEGVPVALGSRAFDLLLALAQRPDRLVTKQELLDLVWPGLVVEENNIATQIGTLRKLLGAQAITTVAGRGYRLTVAPQAGAAPSAEATPPNNLPPPRTRFIGRESALADLARLLPATRLLTLTGIGGCGKTRLALQFAHAQRGAFAGGVWFVDLAPVRDAQRVAAACVAALALEPQPGLAPAAQLAAHLAGRDALIVLDNCEHVRAGAAALADALLAQPGSSRLLATSREPLGVAGEQLLAVPPLSLPASTALGDVLDAEAVRVFADRVRLALPAFEVDAGNAAAVAEVCARLDGIALALELAAARVPMLSVSDLATRLHHRFALLEGASPHAARAQTLRATMQWSEDQLETAQQRMLRRLSVFSGGCTLAAAAAVAQTGDEYAALALLSALHDKSLLLADGGAAGARYRMLETVREYAQQRLDDSGDVDAARALHAAHFLALAESAAPHLRDAQQSAWMARLRDEQENLVAAQAWYGRDGATRDDRRSGLRLAAAAGRYWLFNDIDLGCRIALAALQLDDDATATPERVETLLNLTAIYMHSGRGAIGLPHAHEALAAAERLDAPEWQALALNAVGNCLGRDDPHGALPYYERTRDLARASGNAKPLASALNNIAVIDFGHGRHAAAEQGFREALHLSRAQGDVRSTLIHLHNLVRVLVARRRHEDARACAIEAERLLRGVGEVVLKLELIEVTAGLAASAGDPAVAARLWGFACRRYTDAGYRRPPEDETQLVHLSAAARSALGELEFDRAEAAGQALDLDSALRELRQWLDSAAATAPAAR